MKIKTASEGVIDHKHDVESFFFSIQEIFSQGISLQVIFPPRNQSAGYMFFEITHIPPPPPKSNGMRAGSDL